MNKVFEIEICNKDQEIEFQLPATDYQLLDVIEKLGIIEEVKPSVSIFQYGEGFDQQPETPVSGRADQRP